MNGKATRNNANEAPKSVISILVNLVILYRIIIIPSRPDDFFRAGLSSVPFSASLLFSFY